MSLRFNRARISRSAACVTALAAVLAGVGFLWHPSSARSAEDIPDPLLKSKLVIQTDKESLVCTYDGTTDLAGTKFWLVKAGSQQWAINPQHISTIEVLPADQGK